MRTANACERLLLMVIRSAAHMTIGFRALGLTNKLYQKWLSGGLNRASWQPKFPGKRHNLLKSMILGSLRNAACLP